MQHNITFFLTVAVFDV